MKIQLTLTVEIDENLWASFDDGDEDAYSVVQSRFMNEIMSLNLEPTPATDAFGVEDLRVIRGAIQVARRRHSSLVTSDRWTRVSQKVDAQLAAIEPELSADVAARCDCGCWPTEQVHGHHPDCGIYS